MQDARKAVWSIPYVSVAFFPSLKQHFIAYRFSKVSSRPDCIFEIHQLWQSGFSRVYSNCCCSYSFEPEIIKIDQSSHMMYILNIQESTTTLNACTKKVWKLVEFTTYFYFLESSIHEGSDETQSACLSVRASFAVLEFVLMVWIEVQKEDVTFWCRTVWYYFSFLHSGHIKCRTWSAFFK